MRRAEIVVVVVKVFFLSLGWVRWCFRRERMSMRSFCYFNLADGAEFEDMGAVGEVFA